MNAITMQPEQHGARPATERQIQFANDILSAINGHLAAVAAHGFDEITAELTERLNRRAMTRFGGAQDVIDFLKPMMTKSAIFGEAQNIAKNMRNSEAVKALHPMRNQ